MSQRPAVEGGGAMGGGNDDQDAGFADLQASQAMDHADIADLELGERLPGQSLHLLRAIPS